MGMFFSGRDWETSQDRGNMNGALYREILDESTQDHNPKHTATRLEPDQTSLERPENSWQRRSPSNLTELERICREEWEKPPKYRKYIISCKQTEVPLSVPWDISNQMYLSYNNVSALKIMAARSNWMLSSEKKKVSLYTLEENQILCFKVETHVTVPAEQAFHLLSDLRRRHEWDRHYQQCDVIIQADEDDTIYRVATPCVSKGGKGQDFILLASRRKPCDSRDPYLIALRSVTLPTHPATEDYTRGEVLCAGFSIWEESNSVTKISYYNQATPGVLPYISNDIAGLSSSFYGTFHSCNKYLEENRDSLAVLPPSDL